MSRGLGRRINGSVEDTKLSTNKQHTLSLSVCVTRARVINAHIHTLACTYTRTRTHIHTQLTDTPYESTYEGACAHLHPHTHVTHPTNTPAQTQKKKPYSPRRSCSWMRKRAHMRCYWPHLVPCFFFVENAEVFLSLKIHGASSSSELAHALEWTPFSFLCVCVCVHIYACICV